MDYYNLNTDIKSRLQPAFLRVDGAFLGISSRRAYPSNEGQVAAWTADRENGATNGNFCADKGVCR